MIRRSRATGAVSGLLAGLVLGGLAAVRAAEPAPAPKTYLFFVFSDPAPGGEAAYTRWFADRRHLEHARRAPGVVDVQHYVPGPELRHAPMRTPHDLMIIYAGHDAAAGGGGCRIAARIGGRRLAGDRPPRL